MPATLTPVNLHFPMNLSRGSTGIVGLPDTLRASYMAMLNHYIYAGTGSSKPALHEPCSGQGS